MSTDRDTTRLVRSWLEEGVTGLPDRVLDRVLDELPATPQRRPSWPSRRIVFMNSYAKLVIAAAAVLLVAVVGYQFLPSSSGPGVPTAAPSSSLAPTSTAASTIPAPGRGALAPGRYAWYWSGPPISFAVPTGWTGITTDIFKHQGEPTELTWYRESMPVFNVYTDACHSAGALKPFERTVSGLVAALDTQLNSDATVTDVIVAGRPAKRIDLVASPGIDRATCRNGADLPMQIWADPEETSYFALFPGQRGFVHAMDVDGDLVVLVGLISSQATSADIAELDAIVASIQIGP